MRTHKHTQRTNFGQSYAFFVEGDDGVLPVRSFRNIFSIDFLFKRWRAHSIVWFLRKYNTHTNRNGFERARLERNSQNFANAGPSRCVALDGRHQTNRCRTETSSVFEEKPPQNYLRTSGPRSRRCCFCARALLVASNTKIGPQMKKGYPKSNQYWLSLVVYYVVVNECNR